MGVSTKIFRRLISGVVATTLAFAGVAVGSTPAQAAANPGACINSNWGANGCGGSTTTPLAEITATKSSAITTTAALTYVNGSATPTVGSTCSPSAFELYLSSSSFATADKITTGLASGISFNTATGVFSGTPTTILSRTQYTVVALCTGAGSQLQRFTIYVSVTEAGVKTLPQLAGAIDVAASTAVLSYDAADTSDTIDVNCVSTTTFELYPASDTSFAQSQDSVDGIDFHPADGSFSGTPRALFTNTTFVIVALCGQANANATGVQKFMISIKVTAPDKTLTAITKTVGDSVTGRALSYDATDATKTVTRDCAPTSYDVVDSSGATGSGNTVNGIVISNVDGSISGTASTALSSTTYTIVANCVTHVEKFSLSITINSAAAPSTGGGNSNPAPEKVTICHRTHATTNPYVRITVSIASVMNKAGHESHDEIYLVNHVYNAAIKYPAKDKKWGDIIPADPSGQNRWKPLNWTTLGAAIWNGSTAGCPTMTTQQYYNALRESGVPEKNIKKEVDTLEEEQGKTKTDPASLKYTGPSTKVLEEENDKVTICHATNSVTNPYRKITVSSSSVTNKAGHMSHDDIYLDHHVFDASVNYPANKKDWGDIIPADPTGKNRWAPLNWTDLGQKIYSGAVAGCAEETTQEVYNKLRESGATKKEILEELRKDGNIDDDPADIEDLKYDGKDPEVEKTEPKPPVEPTNVKIPDQSLSGIVWLDLNRDGFKDPEEPLMKGIKLSVVQVTSVSPGFARSGVRSSLRTAAVSSDIKFKAAAVVTVTTDANGFYLFPSLGAGDWQVVTEVPTELSVTYDSQGSNEGEIIATVPVASHAFTYVGLISDNETLTNKLVEENTQKPATVDPTKTPATGTKTPTKTPIKTGVKTSPAGTRGSVNQLAYTGDTPSSLPMGVAAFMVIIGLGFIALGRRKSTN